MLLEYGTDEEGHWTSEKYMANTEEAQKIAEFKYPCSKHIAKWVFVYDPSTKPDDERQNPDPPRWCAVVLPLEIRCHTNTSDIGWTLVSRFFIPGLKTFGNTES